MRYFLIENDRGKRFTVPVGEDAICPYLGHFQYRILGVIDELPTIEVGEEDTKEIEELQKQVKELERQLDEAYEDMKKHEEDEEMKRVIQIRMKRLLAERERLTDQLVATSNKLSRLRDQKTQEALRQVLPQPCTQDMFEPCVGYGKFFLKPTSGDLVVLSGKDAIRERMKYE